MIVQAPPFSGVQPIGGAEVVAATLARALACRPMLEVSVVCGDAGGLRAESTFIGDVRVIPGFDLDDEIRLSGVIAPSFSPEAGASIDTADVVIAFERSVANLPPGVPHVVVLGGVGYPHSIDVLRHGTWDRLVVPSASTVAEAERRAGLNLGEVRVIANGVPAAAPVASVKAPAPAERSPSFRLLFPSHPTVEKGALVVATLVEELGRRGVAVQLTCVEQPARLPGPTDVALPGASRLPWRPYGQMADVYRQHDLTLCLSTVPEGFGLAAAESLLYGTPVLCSDSGNLPHLVPKGHGLFVVESWSSPAVHADVCLRALELGRRECLDRGASYVRRAYSTQAMIDAYAEILDDVISRRRSTRRSESS